MAAVYVCLANVLCRQCYESVFHMSPVSILTWRDLYYAERQRREINYQGKHYYIRNNVTTKDVNRHSPLNNCEAES